MNQGVYDEFSTYSYWRANIDRYKIYRNFTDEPITDLEKRIKYVYSKGTPSIIILYILVKQRKIKNPKKMVRQEVIIQGIYI